ncbi:cuticle collagen 2-like [Gallus gallus]|uniref:cuticle collagen 2-like n=1 Tax=Gallus gallus TaxID=9031 RepID=UPI001AE87C1D|nr:cuticle collagen 2-like [Gallus gallus]XP_040504895.1 cuticle collagen 2-like [Gallus gallus]
MRGPVEIRYFSYRVPSKWLREKERISFRSPLSPEASPGRGGSLGGEEAEDEDDGERSERSQCLQRAAPGWPSRDRRGVMARYERGLPPARRRGPGDPAGRQRGADWLPASAARGGRAGPGRAGPRRPPPGSGSGAEAGAWPAGGGRRAASPARRDSAGERQAGGAAALAGDKQVGPGAEGSVPGRRSEGHGDAGDGGGSTGGLEGGDSRWFPGLTLCLVYHLVSSSSSYLGPYNSGFGFPIIKLQ